MPPAPPPLPPGAGLAARLSAVRPARLRRDALTGPLSDLIDPLRGGVERLGEQVAGGVLRLGVTGLRRSGKTVFVASLVHNLLNPGRLPFFEPARSPEFVARLEPQPDLSVPRFDVEARLAELTGVPPRWPEPTRAVSRVRLAVRYRPTGLVRRRLGDTATLRLDIVDYPGEWLLDLPMLGQDFASWSRRTLELSDRPLRRERARDWRAALSSLDPAAKADEAAARTVARLYAAYLRACRESEAPLSLLQPGRFLEPGEMEGAPALEFCPLPLDGRPARGTLGRLMEDRFEAYKRHVVRRFFRTHFAGLDRQVVLVDLLGAMNAGAEGVADLRTALETSLAAFRHGRPSWLERLFRPSIDRVLFAATKADHVAAGQHARLRALMQDLVKDARDAIRFEGAAVETMAVAAVKCTETVTVDQDGRPLACVKGIPVGRSAPTVLFPGELPESLADLAEPRHRFLRFDPPAGLARDGRGLPNVRLDQALQFLVGDRLA